MNVKWLNRFLCTTSVEASQHLQHMLDDEAHTFVEQARDEARQLVGGNRAKLDALPEALLAHETLEKKEAYAAAGLERPTESRRSHGVRASQRRA